ncbi:MAG: DUF177 domain-containing protein [Rubrivivax sp.]|jgi:uncharacterized protein|nr:DUF177 domain-containing protein [Rubrivivax sp.]MBK7264436.1 DUF177 domain-containing protein [Rubrivivax sp.]MBK8530114.1 DUF177 domain-containing protein [Rubrivivax sp.]
MRARDFDPRRLDVPAFAKSASGLVGECPLPGFTRLSELLVMSDAELLPSPVRWSAEGRVSAVAGAGSQPTLRLRVEAALPMRCQRCLNALVVDLTLERQFVFVADEAAAERLDEDDEHEVLVLTRELDLHELLEDELLLDLPLVPRHAVCPQPLLAAQVAQADDDAAAAHPFAALAALRRDAG